MLDGIREILFSPLSEPAPFLIDILYKEGRSGIDVLTGKSKLLDYPGDYQKNVPALAFADLLEILQKNKSKLGVKLVEGKGELCSGCDTTTDFYERSVRQRD